MKPLLTAASLFAAVACKPVEDTALETCFPGLADGEVRGIALHLSAPGHGSSTLLLSETCRMKALNVEFDPADDERVKTLAARQNPGAWRLDGKASTVDYRHNRVRMAPRATLAPAPGMTGAQLYSRFKTGSPLQ